MIFQFEAFLKDIDKTYKNKRIRAKSSIELPVEMIFNPALPLSSPRVYAALKYLQVGSKPIRVSHNELAKITGLSKHTVTKALKKLKQNDFLEIKFCWGDTNIYQFPQKSKIK